MAEDNLGQLRRLAGEDEWGQIAGMITRGVRGGDAAQITEMFTELGQERESGKDLAGALHCYRMAVWSNCLYYRAAKSQAEYERRWWLGAQVRWKFQEGHRKFLKTGSRRREGEAVTVDELWSEGWPRLKELACDGATSQAETLLVLLEVLPDDDGDRGIATAGKLEKTGDKLAASNKDAAAWFYLMASERFSSWVSSASSGGEGMARSAMTNTAAKKLAALKSRKKG